MPVYGEAAVVSEGEWQSAQPTAVNSFWPFFSDAEAVVGAAGADSRMKAAKFTTSDDISDPVPVGPPLYTITEASSGVALNTQPGTAERSFMKTSLATPC